MEKFFKNGVKVTLDLSSRVCVCVRAPQAPPSDGFIGCIKDLMLNEVPAGSPTYSQGAVPCFQDPLQPGVYFPGRGGHMAIGGHSSSVVLLCLLVSPTVLSRPD